MGREPFVGLSQGAAGAVTGLAWNVGGRTSNVERRTSGHMRVRVGGGEPVGGGLVDEAFVEEPLDGAALGAYVLERVPARHELGVALVEPVLEPSECSASPEGVGQSQQWP